MIFGKKKGEGVKIPLKISPIDFYLYTSKQRLELHINDEVGKHLIGTLTFLPTFR